MNRRKTALLACFGLLAWGVGGQEQPAEAAEDQPANAQNEQTSVENDEQDAPESADLDDLEDVFTPSENISEDISVPLPVDI